MGFWGEYIGNRGFLTITALKRKKEREDVMKSIKLVVLMLMAVVFVAGCSQNAKVSLQAGMSDAEKDLFLKEIEKRAESTGQTIFKKGEIVLFDKYEYPDFTGKKIMTCYAGYIPITLVEKEKVKDSLPLKIKVYFQIGFGRVEKINVTEDKEVGTLWITQYVPRGMCLEGEVAKQEEYKKIILEDMKVVREYVKKVGNA